MSRGLRIILYLVYAVIVAALAGFIIADFGSNSAPAPKVATHHQPSGISKNQHQPAPTAAPKAAISSNQAAASAGSLADTGPGNVAGLFVLATAGGTILYRRILVRRLD